MYKDGEHGSAIYSTVYVIGEAGLTEAGACVGPLDDGPLAGVVEHRALGQRYVGRDACDRYPAGGKDTGQLSAAKKCPVTTLSSDITSGTGVSSAQMSDDG